jgi:hypothetical protein
MCGSLEADHFKPNFIYGEFNCELFQNYLVNNCITQCLEENCSNSEIDVAVKHLTDTLNRAASYTIQLKTRTLKSMQLGTSTRLLIQKWKKLRTLWQRTHDITLRPLINSLKEQTVSAIKGQLSDT